MRTGRVLDWAGAGAGDSDDDGGEISSTEDTVVPARLPPRRRRRKKVRVLEPTLLFSLELDANIS